MATTSDYRRWLAEVGGRVRERRDSLGKTQPEIADAVTGLDQSGLSRLERGLQGFDSDTLFHLSAALKAPAYALLGGADPTGHNLSPRAIEIAKQWDTMTPGERLRFEALLWVAKKPVDDERVRDAFKDVPLAGRKKPK